MSVTRVYQAIPLARALQVQLDEKASHHLARVLRKEVGDKIILFNGEGGEYEAVITAITKKHITVNILGFSDKAVESPVDIYLAQGLARGEKMDFIIQKAVELGVKKIIPLITTRCNVRLNEEREEKRLSHWKSVSISAAEQCGRTQLPQIEAPLSFANWLPTAKANKCFVLSPHVQPKLPDQPLPPHASILLLIGPEGGLSDEEVKAAIEHQFIPLNLGPRILRTETAPIAAISVLQYCFGDLGKNNTNNFF